jgi:hypothetical protein
VTIGTGITRLEQQTFWGNVSLTGVTIPDNITSFGGSVFNGCTGLTTAILSNNLTGMEQQAFINCKSLTGINIPTGVTSIGNSAFDGCTGLATINCYAPTPPTVGSNVFTNINTTDIHVPQAASTAYGPTFGGLNVVADL